MIYNLISGNEIVRRLTNDHNINVATELSRIPKWILQASDSLKLLNSLIPASYYTNVVNGFATLPDDLRYLIGVEYNGVKLPRKEYKEEVKYDIIAPNSTIYYDGLGLTVSGTVESITYNDDKTTILANVLETKHYDYIKIVNAPVSTSDYYVLMNKQQIETSFTTGNIWIYYYKLPLEYNEEFGVRMPLIAENEEVITYITCYVIVKMMQRGYKHPIYDFNANNEFTNPGIMLKKAYIPALNSANAWDQDKSNRINRLWNSALYNQIAQLLDR